MTEYYNEQQKITILVEKLVLQGVLGVLTSFLSFPDILISLSKRDTTGLLGKEKNSSENCGTADLIT